MSFLDELHKQFVIPVLRETEASQLEKSAIELGDKDFQILELTLMSENVFSVIKKLSSKKGLTVGAGTVLNEDQAKKAIDNGAQFLVSPGFSQTVLTYAEKNQIPYIPGVLTPSEIMQVKTRGCDLIKIFPISSVGGASYLKHLSGPFPNGKWMPSGGVTLEAVKDYKEAGAFCVGVNGKNLKHVEQGRAL